MALIISVIPANDGWAIQADGLPGDLSFRRGGEAEVAARALAERLARSGSEAEVRIFLRDGALAGRFVHPARPTHTALAS